MLDTLFSNYYGESYSEKSNFYHRVPAWSSSVDNCAARCSLHPLGLSFHSPLVRSQPKQRSKREPQRLHLMPRPWAHQNCRPKADGVRSRVPPLNHLSGQQASLLYAKPPQPCEDTAERRSMRHNACQLQQEKQKDMFLLKLIPRRPLLRGRERVHSCLRPQEWLASLLGLCQSRGIKNLAG